MFSVIFKREDTAMTTQFYKDHTELSQAQKQQIVDCLLADRMNGYEFGVRYYGFDHFKKMSAQRSRLRKRLRFAEINNLNWKNLYLHHFHFENGEVECVVDLSPNQEITRYMQQLLSKTKN